MGPDDIKLNELLQYSPFYQVSPDTDKTQIAHRLKLVEFWSPQDGDRILEIGCGQGGTTIVLADAVGAEGFVHGIDNASPDYGSPTTLSEARDFIKNSKIGSRIAIDFETDILSPDIVFPEKSFDLIVLSLCSWYFSSIGEFRQVLRKTRSWGKKLAYAEWDPNPTTINQLPHFMAVLLWAQSESYKEESDANLRTLITPMEAKRAAMDIGWEIEREDSIVTPEMHDARWEVDGALEYIRPELADLKNLPSKVKNLMESQIDILDNMNKNQELKSLPTYTFTGV